MGSEFTYWIILFDDYGVGLNLVNPRLLEENGRNWFIYDGQPAEWPGEHIAKKHGLDPSGRGYMIHWAGNEPQAPRGGEEGGL